MELPAFFEPDKWLWIISPAFGWALFGLGKYGHKWCAVILHHKREMLRINLKEAARKEHLRQKVERASETRAKGKDNDKSKRKRKTKR